MKGAIFMSKRSKYNAEEKLEILMQYHESTLSISEICQTYGINRKTLSGWRYNYETYGKDGLEESKTWKIYSKDLKLAAIENYLSGNYSQGDIVKIYELSGKSIFRRWIKQYNSHRELKDTAKGRALSMTKGRKTTLEERIEIVKHCLNHSKDYQLTADIYKVSYQQVYSWARKFDGSGEKGLEDRRGNTKVEFTDADKVQIEMRKLKQENERLKMENDFLKKLKELERRGR
jgi:transposase